MRHCLKNCAILATILATGVFAHATTITFGSTTGGSPTPFTSYTQAGYTVTQGSTGQFDANPNQGNPPPGITSGTDIGDPTSSIVLTDGSSSFDLSSFDLDAYTGTASYTLIGTLKGAFIFSVSGADTAHNWTTISTFAAGNDAVDSVTLTFSDTAAGTEYSVDNLVVAAAAPEPGSLILAGTGLLGLAGAFRRRFAV